MDEKRGGRRANSGRKKKLERHQTPIEAAELRCADRLPQTIGNLERIADGEVEQTEEEWAAAATITIGKGAYVKCAYPNLPPAQMVLVRKKTVTFAPDKAANIYLADRVMGKPSDGDEQKINDLLGAEIDAFVAKIRKAFDPATAEAIIATIGEADADDSSERA